jgi:hypothetical protein
MKEVRTETNFACGANLSIHKNPETGITVARLKQKCHPSWSIYLDREGNEYLTLYISNGNLPALQQVMNLVIDEPKTKTLSNRIRRAWEILCG